MLFPLLCLPCKLAVSPLTFPLRPSWLKRQACPFYLGYVYSELPTFSTTWLHFVSLQIVLYLASPTIHRFLRRVAFSSCSSVCVLCTRTGQETRKEKASTRLVLSAEGKGFAGDTNTTLSFTCLSFTTPSSHANSKKVSAAGTCIDSSTWVLFSELFGILGRHHEY